MSMQHIFGNTFPVREQLKKLGARWNPARRCWDVVDDRADEARRIVAVGPTAEVLFPPKGDCPVHNLNNPTTVADLYAGTIVSEPEPDPVYVPPPPCQACGWQRPGIICPHCTFTELHEHTN